MADTFQLDFRPEPALYSTGQAAIYLGVSVRTIKNLLRERQLVKRKIGARTLIPVTSLKAFLTKDHPTGQHGRDVEDAVA
jgi:excisionase family DNA binding protein